MTSTQFSAAPAVMGDAATASASSCMERSGRATISNTRKCCASRPTAGIRDRARRAALSPMSTVSPPGGATWSRAPPTHISAACLGGSEMRTELTPASGPCRALSLARGSVAAAQLRACARRGGLRAPARCPRARGLPDDPRAREGRSLGRAPRRPRKHLHRGRVHGGQPSEPPPGRDAHRLLTGLGATFPNAGPGESAACEGSRDIPEHWPSQERRRLLRFGRCA